jgi:hypothetical protein
MTASMMDRPHGGPAIQDQIARGRNDRAVGTGLSPSLPASHDRKHKSGREDFAVTTFCAVFSSELWPWMQGGEALIGGFPTNVVNTRTPAQRQNASGSPARLTMHAVVLDCQASPHARGHPDAARSRSYRRVDWLGPPPWPCGGIPIPWESWSPGLALGGRYVSQVLNPAGPVSAAPPSIVATVATGPRDGWEGRLMTSWRDWTPAEPSVRLRGECRSHGEDVTS